MRSAQAAILRSQACGMRITQSAIILTVQRSKTVSVIIPAYNYARYIAEAIDSALAQTHAPLEVIVVDDESTDDTPRVLAAYGDRIRAIRQRNGGAGAARNTGIAAARGEYVAFLDADDVWLPRKLELQLQRFEADPGLGLVHCAAEVIDAQGRTVDFVLEGHEGWVGMEMLRLDGHVMSLGSNLLVPRRIVEEAGGFDARLPPSEDWDFAYRVASRYPVAYIAEPLVRYRQHGGGIHLNIPEMERSMLLALDKAFTSRDPAVQALRAHSYGQLHRILAGCYFQAHQPGKFLRHAVKSLRYDAGNFGYFAAYPWRALTRRARVRRAATPAA